MSLSIWLEDMIQNIDSAYCWAIELWVGSDVSGHFGVVQRMNQLEHHDVFARVLKEPLMAWCANVNVSYH